MVDPDGMMAGPTHVPGTRKELVSEQLQSREDWNDNMGYTGNDVASGMFSVQSEISAMIAQRDAEEQTQNLLSAFVQIGELSEDINISPAIRKVLDYIYDKEGTAYEDQHSKPPTDQPTKFGIELTIFKDHAKEVLGISPTVASLKALTQDQADIFYMKVYVLPYGYYKLTNFLVLNALLSQAPLGQSRVQKNAKTALNSLLGTSFDINYDSFTSDEAGSLNNLSTSQTKQYINNFGALQYHDYMYLYNTYPKRNGEYINGWINRLNELVDPKYDLPK